MIRIFCRIKVGFRLMDKKNSTEGVFGLGLQEGEGQVTGPWKFLFWCILVLSTPTIHWTVFFRCSASSGKSTIYCIVVQCCIAFFFPYLQKNPKCFMKILISRHYNRNTCLRPTISVPITNCNPTHIHALYLL